MGKVIVLLALLLFFAENSHGSEAIGLREAVQMSLEKNHLLGAARFERDAAVAMAHASRSLYLPRIAFEERAAVTNSGTKAFMMRLDEGRFTLAGDLNNPDNTGDFQTSVTLQQPIFDLNISRGVDVAEEASSVRTYALEKRSQDVAFQVYRSYLELQRATAQLAVAGQAVRDAEEHRRLASVRSAAGVGLKFDELRIGTFVAEVEQQKITADNAVTVARLRLGQAIGLEPGSAPLASEPVTAVALTLTTEELEREAFANRPDFKQVTAGVAEASAGLAAARGTYWPTLYAHASYQMNDRDVPFGRDNDSWMAGATARWEVFDGFRRNSDVERASAMKSAQESYLSSLRQEVSLQVRESLLRRVEAEKRLQIARSAVRDAEEMIRLVNRRFENALATTVELLDAQTALNRARAQLADNEANFALATAYVYQSAGLFMEEVVK